MLLCPNRKCELSCSSLGDLGLVTISQHIWDTELLREEHIGTVGATLSSLGTGQDQKGINIKGGRRPGAPSTLSASCPLPGLGLEDWETTRVLGLQLG